MCFRLHFFFSKNQIILAEAHFLFSSVDFRLICSYFVFVITVNYQKGGWGINIILVQYHISFDGGSRRYWWYWICFVVRYCVYTCLSIFVSKSCHIAINLFFWLLGLNFLFLQNVFLIKNVYFILMKRFSYLRWWPLDYS